VLATIGEILGSNIRDRRKALGMTQEAFALSIQIPYRTFQSIEAGASWPELANLLKISRGLNVSASALFSYPASQVTPEAALKVLADLVERTKQK